MEYLPEVSWGGGRRLVSPLSARLSLRSAVKAAVVCSAERKRVGLGGVGGGVGGGDIKCLTDSLLLLCPHNCCLVDSSEMSDLSALWFPLSCGASWKYYCTHTQPAAITRRSAGHFTIHYYTISGVTELYCRC